MTTNGTQPPNSGRVNARQFDTAEAIDHLNGKAAEDAPLSIDDLVLLLAVLRDPERGCPWDREQNFASIVPYTIEEAYEVADAIERGDRHDLKDELGDLLLQVIYHSQMAQEEGAFAFASVADWVTRKMIRRHPHVFGDEELRASVEMRGLWDRIKAEEAQARADGAGTAAKAAGSVLSGVPAGLPALTRAVKLQKKAAKVGFDWPDPLQIMAKLREEFDEFECEMVAGERDKAEEEFGDLLFVCANLARRLSIDPETALRGANAKFERRFSHIERRLAESERTPADATLEEMDAYWDEAKELEKQRG